MKKLMISFMVLVICAFFIVSTPKVLAYNSNEEISVIKLQNTVTNDNDDNNDNNDTTTDDNLNTDTTDDDDNDTTYDDDKTEEVVDDNENIFTNLLYGIIGLLIGIVITYLFTSSRKIR